MGNMFSSITVRAFTGELTESWRDGHKDELQLDAVERDKKLGLLDENEFSVEVLISNPDKLKIAITQSSTDAANSLASMFPSPSIDVSEMTKMLGIDKNFTQFEELARQALSAHSDLLMEGMTDAIRKLSEPIWRSLADKFQPLSQTITQPLTDALNQTAEIYRLALAREMAGIAQSLLPESMPAELAEIYFNLGRLQKEVLKAIQRRSTYFTAEKLSEEHNLPLEDIRTSLGLFYSLGIINQVTLLTSPTGAGDIYVPMYRNIRPSDSSRSEDLIALGLNPGTEAA